MVSDRPRGEQGFPGPLGQMLRHLPPRSYVATIPLNHQQSGNEEGGGIQKRHQPGAAGEDAATASEVALPSSGYTRRPAG